MKFYSPLGLFLASASFTAIKFTRFYKRNFKIKKKGTKESEGCKITKHKEEKLSSNMLNENSLACLFFCRSKWEKPNDDKINTFSLVHYSAFFCFSLETYQRKKNGFENKKEKNGYYNDTLITIFLKSPSQIFLLVLGNFHDVFGFS